MSLHITFLYTVDSSGRPVLFDEWLNNNNPVDGYTKEESIIAFNNSLKNEMDDLWEKDDLVDSYEGISGTDEKEIWWRFFKGIPYSEDSEVVPGTPNKPGLVDAMNIFAAVTKNYRRGMTNIRVVRTVDGVITETLTAFGDIS